MTISSTQVRSFETLTLELHIEKEKEYAVYRRISTLAVKGDLRILAQGGDYLFQ